MAINATLVQNAKLAWKAKGEPNDGLNWSTIDSAIVIVRTILEEGRVSELLPQKPLAPGAAKEAVEKYQAEEKRRKEIRLELANAICPAVTAASNFRRTTMVTEKIAAKVEKGAERIESEFA